MGIRFSVIIPAHNAEKHICKALESVSSQSFKDYELIVVCDACTDKTANIAAEYGAKVIEVNYHRDGLTRNAGLDVAQGEYILFMDDDDWWLHEYVLTMIDEVLKANPLIDVLCFSFIWKGRGYTTPDSNNGYHWANVWSKCWARDAIGNIRFNGKWSVSDMDFCNAVFAQPWINVRDWFMPLYYYNYLREGSISEIERRKIQKPENCC